MMSRSSVSAVDTVTVSVARGQPVPPTSPSCVPNCSTEQTALRALGESGKGMANDRRSGPDGTGGTRSAFRPLGVPLFVPRPGPLQRNLHAKRAEDSSNRTRHTSCMSSCPKRNAITSSYSSTRGFPPVNSRRGPAIPQGLPQKSSKKGSEEGPPSPSAAPVVSQRKSQPDKDAEATRGQKPAWRNCSPTSDSPRPPKRRFPLLPHRRGEPLRLPSPPQLGFRVTAEDLDSEKEAALRRILRSLAPDWPAPAAAGASLPCSISGGPDWQQRGTLYLKRQAPAFASAPAPPAKRSRAEASSGGGSCTNSTVGTPWKRRAPAFASAPEPPAKRRRTEASSAGGSSTNSTVVTHASTQLGFGSRAAAQDLSCIFSALSITAGTRGPPSTTHSNGGSVGLNSGALLTRATPMVTTGPSNKKKRRFEDTTAPILSHIPGGTARQGPPTSSGGPSPCPAKAAFRGVLVPASTPSSLTSAVGTARCRLAVRARPLAGHKTTGPSTKSFSSRPRFIITFGCKRRRLA